MMARALIVMAIGMSCASAAEEYSSRRAAVRDEATRLGFVVAVTADCAAVPLDVRVAMPPAHGQLSIVETRESPRFASDHPFAECNKVMAAGKRVDYRSEAGFSGSDTMIVEAIYPNGSVARYTYRVDVVEKLPEVAVRIDGENAPEEDQPRAEPRVSRGPATQRSGPFRFDCDTPEGNFSSWSAPAPGSRVVITGRVKMARAGKHATYIPVAGAAIVESDDRRVALSFAAYPQKPGTLVVAFAVAGGPRFPPRAVAVTTTGADETSTFELRFGSNVLEARVGSVEKRIDIPAIKPTRVDLECSTGQFVFEDVIITD